MTGETLIDIVNRAKARWLKRVMYASPATSTQKVFAYAIADHLNCVTLDSWPAQATLTRLMGRRSEKTVQRAARGLKMLNFIAVVGSKASRSGCRYAPAFAPADWDRIGRKPGQKRADALDTNVHLSNLSIQLESSSTAARGPSGATVIKQPFNPASRGASEMKVAEMLGTNGFDILSRLSTIDDAVVNRLCRALAEGQLGDRELAAARLAAEQVRP